MKPVGEGIQLASPVMFVLYCEYKPMDYRDARSDAFCRLLANITRCFFWLGSRFEIALLLQSIFMILAQVLRTSLDSIREFTHA